MKEDELRAAAKCVICGKGIGYAGLPLFWRVRIERYGLKSAAIQRQAGLETFFGGHVALAQVMGANEDMAEKISSKEVTVCESCAVNKAVLLVVLAMEDGDEKDSK